MADIVAGLGVAALDEASLSRFHLRAVLVSGMGFFTDAYDLFIIGIASTLIAKGGTRVRQARPARTARCWRRRAWGRLSSGVLRTCRAGKRVYWVVAAIMIVAAVGSALSPSFWVLVMFRFLLGFGVGGDYPVSAVLMSEYANRRIRGKLVGLVFGDPGHRAHRRAADRAGSPVRESATTWRGG